MTTLRTPPRPKTGGSSQFLRNTKIPTLMFHNASEVDKHVALVVESLIRENNSAGVATVLGLPTGSTPIGVYRELIRLHREEGLDFSQVITFNLDEYYPMSPGSIHSYNRWMRANFFDHVMEMGVDGITVSPGYAYERAPDQQHFLNREKTRQLFRGIFSRGRGARNWRFSQSGLFLDFLAGNQSYHCTPWGNPTRTVFGWQRPCYLLGEGYAKTFKELMEETDWDSYGTGNYEKCADCMVHSGYEATAVGDAITHPLKAAMVALRGVKTEGDMVPEINLENQRPAQYVFSRHVEKMLAEIKAEKAEKKAQNLTSAA